MVGSRGQSWCLARGIVARLGLGGRDVPDRLGEAVVVEPGHPLEGGVFDGFKAPPRATAADDLRFEQPDHRLGERVDAPMLVKGHLRLRTERLACGDY